MSYARIVTPEEIETAQAAGWRVNDINTATASVRGPNWILTNPEGKIVKRGWSASDAWQGLVPEPVEKINNQQRDYKAIWESLKPFEQQELRNVYQGKQVLTAGENVATSAIAKIVAERNRQDSKWGEQNHDAGKWSLILTEELGEVAKSQLEGDRANYLTELVQSAAVLVAWLECELRREP